jgi:hypothetical protein
VIYSNIFSAALTYLVWFKGRIRIRIPVRIRYDLKHDPDPDQDQIIPNPQHCFILFSQDLSQLSKYAALCERYHNKVSSFLRCKKPHGSVLNYIYKRRKDQRLSNDQITCEKLVYRTERSEPQEHSRTAELEFLKSLWGLGTEEE